MPHNIYIYNPAVLVPKNAQHVTVPAEITVIHANAFRYCYNIQSVTIPDGVTEIGFCAFHNCPGLRSLIYKGINIAPFINIDGYGVNTFDVIKTFIKHRIPLSENTIRQGIDMQHRGMLSQWIQEYPVFGGMCLPATAKRVSERGKERLRQCFAGQKRTGGHIPRILDELAITVRACRIPPERLTGTFDIKYTENLLNKKIPIVPATACRLLQPRHLRYAGPKR